MIEDTQPTAAVIPPPSPLPYDEEMADAPVTIDNEMMVDDTPSLDSDTVEDSAEAVLMAQAATGVNESQLKAQGSVNSGIRTEGDKIFAEEGMMHRELAQQAAAKGDGFSMQEFLSTVNRMSKIQEGNRIADYTKAVAQRAAENTVLNSPAATHNNSLEDLDKMAKEQGLAYASEIMRGSREKKLWGKESGAWEGAGTFVSVLGTLALASKAHPVLGTLVSAGTTAYSIWEHNVLKNGIKEITGIDIGEKWGVSDTLEAANKHWASLPVGQALEEHRKLYDYILAKGNLLPGFVGKSFASGLASRVHTGVENQPGWGLSNRTMDMIDGVAAIPDAVALTKLLHSPFTAAKSTEVLSGASEVGKIIANDAVKNADTFKIGEGQQVEWLLSSNIEQLFPDAIKGSAGAGQKVLKEETAKLAAKLDDQIRLNPNDMQLKTIRDVVAKNYAESPNSVALWDASSGELWLQHPGRAAPFVTKEVAEATAEKMRSIDPEGVYVVKATNEPSASKPMLSIEDIDDVDIPEHAFTTKKEVMKLENPALAEVLSDTGANSAASALEAIAAGSKRKELATLAERLLSNKSFNLEGVSLTTISDYERKQAGGKITGIYRYLEDSIGLDRKGKVPTEATIVHEVVHAATSQIIEAVRLGKGKVGKTGNLIAEISREQRDAVDSLNVLYKSLAKSDVKLAFMGEKESISRLVKMDESGFTGLDAAYYSNHKDFEKYYGFTNVHEMMAEALTNRDFARALKNIPISRIVKDPISLEVLGGSVRTAWDALKEVWHKLLGIKSQKEVSAFDVLMDNTLTMVDKATEAERTILKRKADMGLLTEKDISGVAHKRAPSHGYYVVRQPSAKLTHEQKDIDTYVPLGDPKHNASEIAMHERYVTQGAEQKDKKAFMDFIKATISPLNRKEFDRVDKVLREGDTLRMEFDDVALGSRLNSEKEKTAYYAFRTLENIALRIKNTRAIQQLEREGWSQGVLKIAGQSIPVPVRISQGEFVGKKAWDTRSNGWITVDANTSVIKTRNAVEVDGQKTTLFVKDNDAAAITGWLPQIPSLPGSYRRIYKQDYFGSVKMNDVVDGDVVPKTMHLRTSNSGKDMDKWSKGMNSLLKQHKAAPGSVSLVDIEKQVGKWENPEDVLKSINNGEWDNYAENGFEWKYNRSEEDHLNSLVQGVGDFAEADKKSRGMKLESIDKWNLDNTLSPMESLGAELSNVARVRNIGPWRDKWVDTWWNTFGKSLDPNFVKGRKPIEVMSDPSLNFSYYTGGDVAAKFAEKQRKYLLAQVGMPTIEERWFKSAVESFTYAFTGDSKVGQKVVMAGHAMRHADPLQFARSFNFYTMLGAWNPAQLFVQTQAMVNIVAISPAQGMKAALSTPSIRVGLMSDNVEVWKKAAKTFNGSEDDFIKTVKALRKSGILDGIGATSMHNIENGALNMFNGMFKKAVGTNTMFFNRAEEAVRITAFDTARREWQAANKGMEWTSDAALKNILSRTDDLTQNMTAANLAWYQRGVASIPGQFLQYQIKLAANLISSFYQKGAGRGYTRAEAGRVIGAHLMMYGLAGNGIVSMYDEMSQGYEAVSGKKLSDDQKLFLVEGMMAGLANEISQYVSGEDLRVGFGSRLGTFNWYTQIGESALNMGATKLQVLLGPSQTIPKKMGAISHLFGPIETGDYSLGSLSSAANATLKEVFSSWNNAQKAVWAWNHDRKLVTNQGSVLAHMSTAGTFMTGLGLPPAEQYDYWRFMANKKALDTAVRGFAKDYAILEERETEALIRSDGKIDDTVVGYMQAKAKILDGVDVGMRDLFEAERIKHHRMKMDTSGVPSLVIKRLELHNKGVKLKDTPSTNTKIED